MVRVPIRVRPLQGYHYPHKIDLIEMESHERLEAISQRYSTAGSTTKLYKGPNELPLNSSIGSHNLQDYTILECCRSPDISAALTAVMKDLNRIRDIPPESRDRENLIKILQTPEEIRNNPNHEIWQVNSWSPDRLKTRTINCAIIKAVLQRQDRFQGHDLPQCNDCQSLYDALMAHNVWNGGDNSQRFQRQAHIFKPEKANGRGKSVNWILVDEKLQIINRIKNEFRYGNNQIGYDERPAEDALEEFVRRDHARHPSSSNNSSRQRASRSNTNNEDSVSYLQYLGDPLVQSPIRPQLNQNQSSSPIQSKDKPPQYASGPFAVLATLYLAAHAPNGQRLLTLTEEQLKRLAQPHCRSNLYDKGRIRGRSAFACMDGLIKKGLVRKEIVRNSESAGCDVEKWGLLKQGEVLGSYYLQFQKAVNNVIPPFNKNRIIHDGASNDLVLCVDTREDVHLCQRIKWRCEDERIEIVERELPAGDYIFLDQRDRHDYIVPLVIERKSWSDLADSLQGKGRSSNRLDCVKIGRESNTFCGGNCQLCKMKRCGCSQIMFIIEGERCRGYGITPRQCNENKRCSACKQLIERHGVAQQVLEQALTKLQLEHGCYIQYTKSYNETITALFMIRDLLNDRDSFAYKTFAKNKAGSSTLPYNSYATNALSRNTESVVLQRKINKIHQNDVEALAWIFNSDRWKANMIDDLIGPERNLNDDRNNTTCIQKRSGRTQSNISPNEGLPRKRRKTSDDAIRLHESDDDSEDTINLLDDSQDSVILLDDSQDDDSIIVIDHDENAATTSNTMASLGKNKDDRMYEGNTLEELACTLLILHGMDDYDSKFEKKVNEIWNKVYTEVPHDVLDPDNRSNLYDKAISNLRDSLQESSFPYIQRQSFMASSLWIQIKLGVQIRIVQDQILSEELKRLVTDKVNRENSFSLRDVLPRPIHNPSSTHTKTNHSHQADRLRHSYSSPVDAHVSQEQVFTVAPSTEKRQPKTMSKDVETARLARLRRFDKCPSTQVDQKRSEDVWICPRCTFENSSTDNKICSVCGELRAWSCSVCTFENSPDVIVCVACENPNIGSVSSVAVASRVNHTISNHGSFTSYEKDFKRSAALPIETVSSSKPTRSIRCGACGLEGHNRSSATVENCPAYNSANEVQRREAQWRKKQEQIIEQQQTIERLERERFNADNQYAEWLRQTNLMKEHNAQAQELRADELKRVKKKLSRMQKRQNKNM